ncbi:MAG TPA: DUF1697 domain-containing protein [Terracidiphilus sp.]|jgi:uncharacterized protein (DUF1697 family)
MPTYVILLRAVNVGGYGKVSMAEFRKMLTDLGFTRVETYIQSGNAVVDAKGSAAKVAQAVADGFKEMMGASPGVVVRTHEQLERVVKENPFAAEAAAEGAKVHVAFLAGPAAAEARAALERIVQRYPKRRDRYHLANDHIYFHLPDGAAETKFTGKTLDKALGVMGTGRNWNTVMKLWEMSRR